MNIDQVKTYRINGMNLKLTLKLIQVISVYFMLSIIFLLCKNHQIISSTKNKTKHIDTVTSSTSDLKIEYSKVYKHPLP